LALIKGERARHMFLFTLFAARWWAGVFAALKRFLNPFIRSRTGT
jgi:Ni,Fe-hydrogenase I cytochrome b subunit